MGLGAAVAGGLLLGACGDESGPTSQPDGSSTRNALLAAFPQSTTLIPAGQPFRLPFLISDQEGVPLTTIPGPVDFTVTMEGQPVGDPVQVAPYGDGVPRAYLPLIFTFPTPGTYDVVADFDGQKIDASIAVFDKEKVRQPLPGAPLPPADTPTESQTLRVNPICTRVPACPFHTVNLRYALGQGKPIVVLLSTPAYCQTAVCGPILEMLIEEAGQRTDITVIHSEVYVNPKENIDNLAKAQLAPLPDVYNMEWEPALFVTDAADVLQARADVIIDRSEMAQLLELAR
jgi:hypothetical protein